jgi:hypothetical protein
METRRALGMTTAIIALPITSVKANFHTFSNGWPNSWAIHGFGPSKQVRWMGNSRYSKSKVKTFIIAENGIPLASGLTIRQLVQVVDSKNFNIVIAIIDLQTSLVNLQKLIKVGNAANAKLFEEKCGIYLDGSSIINATCIVNNATQVSDAKDGTLQTLIGPADFYFEVAYGLGAAAVMAERLLLETATKATFKPGVLASQARKSLSLTENWLSLPASDSTHILQDLNLLRESLYLDQRMIQVRRSLKHQTSKVNQLIAYAISIPTLLATAIATIRSLNLDLIETGLVMAAVSVSIILIILTWQLVNSKSR